MGKALVFNGIRFANPLRTVNFTEDGYEVVNTYLAKLSSASSVTKAQKKALNSLWGVVVEQGLADNMVAFYPMWSNGNNVADCSFGIKGDDLTIPTGSTYVNGGLCLTGATDGYGAQKTGVYLGESLINGYTIGGVGYYSKSTPPTYSMAIATSKSSPASSDSDYGFSIGSFGSNFSIVKAGVFSETIAMEQGVVSCGIDSESVISAYNNDNLITSAGNSITWYNYYSLNGAYQSAYKPLDDISFVWIYNGAITTAQQKALNDAIVACRDSLGI